VLRLVALLTLLASVAQADPVRLRIAVIAPDGTAYARALRSFSTEVANATDGKVQFKWYFGGIAGDDLEVLSRIRRGQLDGTTGTLSCSEAAPSLKVVRLLGLLRNRDEFHHVLEKLRPRIRAEMQKSGFADLGYTYFGTVILFSRTPIRSMADLRANPAWTWSIDEVWSKMAPELGVRSVFSDVGQLGPLWDQGKVDTLFAFPSAALAYQWSTRARYYTELPMAMLPACILISLRAMDSLPLEHQEAIRNGAARLSVRFEEQMRTDDAALLHGLFEKQGLHRIVPSESFRAEFFEAARGVRDRVGPRLVPPTLLSEVLGWLADYRALVSNH
jgi:TRAP-type C4-dicarboxylate transport system substrate-binding protein